MNIIIIDKFKYLISIMAMFKQKFFFQYNTVLRAWPLLLPMAG